MKLQLLRVLPPLLFSVAMVVGAEPVEPAEPTYRLTGGTVYAVRSAKGEPVGAAIAFADGSQLSPGGELRRADGTVSHLEEGQTVTATGKLNPLQIKSAESTENPAVKPQ